MPTETPARAWPRDIYDVFKQVGIEQIAYVPDAGHAQLIHDCEADNAMNVVSLTTEEEGVAMTRWRSHQEPLPRKLARTKGGV